MTTPPNVARRSTPGESVARRSTPGATGEQPFTSVDAMKAHYLRQILLAPVYQAAVETPLQPMNKLSQRLGHQVFLKREDQQPIYSFKLRGAFNKLHQLQQQGVPGVICASAGNHAQGVAYSAAKLGMQAVVVMPVTTAEIKVSAVRDFGAEVILHGVNFDSASDYAHQLAKQRQLAYVPPFDDDAVIAGQGTVAKEILSQQQQLDAVFIPVGGGGLLAGMAAYIKSICPEIKVIGVEPKDAASLTEALAAHYPMRLEQVGLFADGTAVKQVGQLTYTVAAALCDEVITVSSDEICAAIKDIFDDARAIAEPAGALALAGLKLYARRQQQPGLRLATVLSGANLNFDRLRYIAERSEIGELREAIFAVTIAEQVGSFRKFCQVLGNRVITEFNYRYADAEQAHIFVGIKLSDGQAELDTIKRTLTEAGYPFADLSSDELAKQHIRHMVGGRPLQPVQEKLFQVTFPEHPQALRDFLTALGDTANITLFHYRNHGAAYGDVLVGFAGASEAALMRLLNGLDYPFVDVSGSPSYQFFLQGQGQGQGQAQGQAQGQLEGQVEGQKRSPVPAQ